MKAFPLICLGSADLTLNQAIPQQLRHVFDITCEITTSVDDFKEMLIKKTPELLITDDESIATFVALNRKENPLLAVISIGVYPPPKPLSVSLSRPLCLPALINASEQLLYERRATGGDQSFTLLKNMIFSPSLRQVGTKESCVELTDKENTMLLYLYHHRLGLTRQELLEAVWGYGAQMETHTMETHLSRLRGKLREIYPEELLFLKDGRYLITRQFCHPVA